MMRIHTEKDRERKILYFPFNKIIIKMHFIYCIRWSSLVICTLRLYTLRANVIWYIRTHHICGMGGGQIIHNVSIIIVSIQDIIFAISFNLNGVKMPSILHKLIGKITWIVFYSVQAAILLNNYFAVRWCIRHRLQYVRRWIISSSALNWTLCI